MSRPVRGASGVSRSRTRITHRPLCPRRQVVLLAARPFLAGGGWRQSRLPALNTGLFLGMGARSDGVRETAAFEHGEEDVPFIASAPFRSVSANVSKLARVWATLMHQADFGVANVT
jgi:hypothetical protein